MNQTEIITQFLTFESNQDVAGMASLMTDNIVYETPFALPGVQNQVQGKVELSTMLEEFIGKEKGMYSAWDIFNIKVFPSSEPDLFFAEMDGNGTVASSNYAYKQSYISLIRLVDGKVSLWKEYFNPLPLKEAIDSLQGL